MITSNLNYHFEDAQSTEELAVRTAQLASAGWSPKGEPRQVELSVAGNSKVLRFCQVYVRPALLPVCERARAALPAGLAALGGPLWPQDHLVHFYDNDRVMMDSLEAFVLQGLVSNEAIVVIALPGHRADLTTRLRDQDIDLGALEASGQLVLLDAATTLESFLRNGQPDEALFEKKIGALISRLRLRHRAVRAFGETVGLLWQAGNRTATIRLEELWHACCQREDLVLYCAYPRDSFVAEDGESLRHICATHTQVLQA